MRQAVTRRSRLLIAALAITLAVGGLSLTQTAAAAPATAATAVAKTALPSKRPTPQKDKLVNHTASTGSIATTPQSNGAQRVSTKTKWPAATKSTATGQSVAAPKMASAAVRAAGPLRRAGTSPVLLAAKTRVSLATVTVLPHDAAAKAGIDGVVFTVAQATAGAVAVDYSAFAEAAGGGYGARLHLVSLPACALTTPAVAACRTQTPLASTNDAAAQIVSASLPSKSAAASTQTSKAPQVLAATASASSSNGSFAASSLAPSGSWTTTGGSGAFTWSYPILTPPPAAGSDVAPQVSLSYNSATVDGQVAITNNQSSWVGEGWDYQPGFVERTYQTCADDPDATPDSKTGDKCWAGQIVTMSLNGQNLSLVQDDTTHQWSARGNQTEKVERLTGSSNGAQDGEYWKITAANGVQYFFGRNSLGYAGESDTNSTLTEPVYGAHSGDPCYNTAGFSSSSCTQAWRWNLDFVKDPHGNLAAYYYAPETNSYSPGTATTATASYVRAANLTHIDYGLRDTGASTFTGTVPDQVQFTLSERCIVTSTFTCDPSLFTDANASHWPDVPQDQACDQNAACAHHSPTFWTTKRVSKIATFFVSGGTTTWVDNYALAQSIPNTGDPEIHLDSITRTGGNASASIGLPPVSFTYQLMDNRVAGYQGQTSMAHWRMTTITTETGSVTSVTYGQPTRPDGTASGCTATNVPSDPAHDTMLCFPVYWTLTNQATPTLDYFQKYVVTQVMVQDSAIAQTHAPAQLTYYKYLGLPAWHQDDSELTKTSQRTYGQFRGYAQLETRTGNLANISNGVADAQTLTRTTYLRGMGTNISNSLGESIPDPNELAGSVVESQSFGGGAAQFDATVTDFAVSGVLASRARSGGLPDLTSKQVTTTKTRKYTNLAAGGTTVATSEFTYDSLGRKISETDSGTSVADQCTYLQYADSDPVWNKNLLAKKISADGACPAGEPSIASITDETRTFYDNSTTVGDALGAGDATETDTTTENNAGTLHWAKTTSDFDAVGRLTSSTAYTSAADTTGRTTSTAYTPASGGPLTQTVTTNAKGQTTTAVIAPGRGTVTTAVDVAGHRTDAVYDALGRVLSVWQPGQAKATDPATTTYKYLLRTNGPLAVTTGTLVNIGPSQSYVYSVNLYNQFGSLFQTQTDPEGPAGNRIVTDTFTDSHGWTIGSNNTWYTGGVPGQCGSTLVAEPVAAPCAITTPTSNIDDRFTVAHDAIGRTTKTTEYKGNTATSSTTTVYGGDRTTVIPPAGGTTQTSIVDVRGNTTTLQQYTSAPTVSGNVVSGGAHQDTTYGYDSSNRQTSMTDPGGAHWGTTYDLAGRAVQQDDPDAGTSSTTYDDLGEIASTTDARNKSMSYTYDALGRKIGEYTGATPVAGNQTASWTYDTLQAGQPTSSTRIASTGNYVTAVTGYDAYGNPTGSSTTIPASETGISGVYTTASTWSKTHLLLTRTEPVHAGGLDTEKIFKEYTRLGHELATSGNNTPASDTSYLANGQIAQITVGVNVQTGWLTFTHDVQTHRLTGSNLSVQMATPVVEDLAYSYNLVGNITKQVDTQGDSSVSPAPVETTCFTYNALQEMTQAWSATDNCATNPAASGNAKVGGAQPYWVSWTINSSGDRTQQVRHAVPGTTGNTTTNYTFDTAAPAHAPNATSTTSATGVVTTQAFTYDAAGNTFTRTAVTGGTQTFTYNEQGRTQKISSGSTLTAPPGQVSSYVYTADGDELIRHDSASTILFLGTDNQLTYNLSTHANTAVRFYTHAGYTVGERSNGGNPIFVSADLNESSQATILTTVNGFSTITRRRADPYGNPLGAQPSWPDQNGFLNQPKTAYTGLIDMGARIYDPTQGRFLSVDPVLAPLNPQQNNGYSYGGNNPINRPDPTGMCYQDYSTGNYVGVDCGSGGQAGTQTPSQHSNTAYSDDKDCNYGQDYCDQTTYFPKGGDYDSDGSSDSSMDVLRHVIKNVLKMVPVVGNVISAVDCARNPNVWDCVGAVPVIGNAGRAAHGIEEGAEIVSDIAKADKVASDASTVGKNLAKTCTHSFTADTPVLMADGTKKPISQIKTGDKVLSTDAHAGFTTVQNVIATMVHHDDDLLDVKIMASNGQTSTLHTTSRHEIWDITSRTWVEAHDLPVGDHLQQADGAIATVNAVTVAVGSSDMYDLTISTDHTFYAGVSTVLVHNCDDLLDESIAIAAHSNARATAGDGTHYVRGVNPDALAYYVDGVLERNVPNLEIRYGLQNGRTAYWDPAKGAVILDDGAGGGSVYTPLNGYAYFAGLK